MAKLKFNINIFDIFVVLLIVLIGFVGILSCDSEPFLGDKSLLVEIKISNEATIEAILPKIKLTDTVYYSGTKYPIKQVSYHVEQDFNGKVQNLYLTVQGLGDIDEGNSIFNGQRIYLNQKVEIRGDYQVQGYVVDFRYEN